MTIDKNNTIKIPIWLVSIVLPLIVSLLVAYGVFTAGKATLETKAAKTEIEIKALQTDKVDRNEMNLIIKSLERIENKLDSHISNKQ